MFKINQTLSVHLFLLVVMCFLFVECKDKASHSSDNELNIFKNGVGESIINSPSASFSSYIFQYSGGLQSRKTPITVKLAVPVESKSLSDKVNDRLFKIEPSLKGSVKWLDNFTVQFLPASGILDFGKVFKVDFRLSELFPNTKGLGDFSFNQYTYPADWALNLSNIWVDEASSNMLEYEFILELSDVIDIKDMERLISVTLNNKQLPFTLKPLENNNYLLTIPNVEKKSFKADLKINLDGESVGIKNLTITEQVPAILDSYLMNYRALNNNERGFVLSFSKPLADNNYFNNLYLKRKDDTTLKFVTKHVKNQIYVYLKSDHNDSFASDSIDFELFENIYSSDNIRISNPGVYSINLKPLEGTTPSVKFISDGLILPDSKNRVLKFKANMLKAVDLQIVKIYAENMKRFLQANSSESPEKLKQVGRLVFKQTISLEELATKPLNTQQEFALDLNNLFEQEPGSMYYLALSFKPSYTLIKKFYDAEEDLRIKSMSNLTEETKEWDSPSYTSSLLPLSIPYSWRTYSWDQRDNPNDSTFYMDENNVSSRKFAYASKLGLTIKENTDNTLWITANDIITTKPLSKVQLTAYNYQLIKIGEGVSDNNGFARIDCREGVPFIVSGQLDKDITYIKLIQGGQLATSRFDVSGTSTINGLKGFIYGERGVWRPGDTIHVSFVVEDLERRLPKDHPAIFELYNPRGQFYTKQVANAVGNGMYYFKVATKHDDPTGTWDGYVKLGGSTFYKSFSIETIKPNRLKINLDLDSSLLQCNNINNSLTLSSNWLTGASAAYLDTDIELSLTTLSNPFPKFKDYLFRNTYSTFNPDKITILEGTLDSNGKIKHTFKLPEYNNAPGMLIGTLFARVYEPGGERSIHTKDVEVSPFKSYVGLNVINNDKNAWSFETDVKHTIDIVNLTPQGKTIANGQIEYKIYKLSWYWWYDRTDNGLSFLDSQSVKIVDEGQVNTNKDGAARVNFQIDYPSYGYYIIAVKDRNSRHAVYKQIYVDWPYWRGSSNKSSGKGLNTFNFVVDKESYEVGDEIVATLPPLKNGRALISIENGKEVVKREWVDTKEDAPTLVKFKATKEFIPNIYMFVSLFQPHEQTINDSPIRLYGITPIMVTDKSTILTPVISVPGVIEPQKEFTVSVSEKEGKEMTYTLAVVDDGLLDLTSFKTPNAYKSFFAKEALGISTWDMFDDVIGAKNSIFDKIYRIGGDENLAADDAKANRFKPVVHFEGPFVLKKGKSASHKITLPMYVGSVRTMVVAAGDGAYGSADANSFVRSPLMLLSSLPRVLSIGEDVWVPVNVFALEDAIKNVQLKVETSPNITIDGNKTVTLSFPQKGDKLQYFHFKIGNGIGIEKVKFTASGANFTASEEIEIDVRNPNPPIINTQTKVLPKGESVVLPYSFDFKNANQQLSLVVSTIPSFDLVKRLDFLNGYYHGCTEQITSRALPLLYLGYIQELTKGEKTKLDTFVNQTIHELYARQTAEGGFVYWPGSSYNSEWATQYAGMFLLRAKEMGYDVNDKVLKKFVSYLESVGRSQSALNNESNYLQAYNLYVLALANKANLSAMNRLADRKDLSAESMWILASAYALAGKDKVAKELIYKAKTASNSGYYYYYGSSLRDKAFKLLTLSVLNNKEEAFVELKDMVELMNKQAYYQTQSTAYSLMAIGEFAKKIKLGIINYNMTLNGGKSQQISTSKTSNTTEIKFTDLKGNVKVENVSEGDFYVELTERKSVIKDLFGAQDRGLEVAVSYLDKDRKRIELSTLKPGTDFIAHVIVKNTNGHYLQNVALTHIIPTNCEIYGTSQYFVIAKNGDSAGGSLSYQDIRDDRVLSYFNLEKGEAAVIDVNLQAVFSGNFIVPAVSAEVMYSPEINGRSAASQMSISK